MTFDIFVTILETCYSKDDEEGKDDQAGGYGGEDGEELEDGDAEEEEIGDATELFKEVAGKKSNDGVL